MSDPKSCSAELSIFQMDIFSRSGRRLEVISTRTGTLKRWQVFYASMGLRVPLLPNNSKWMARRERDHWSTFRPSVLEMTAVCMTKGTCPPVPSLRQQKAPELPSNISRCDRER